MGKKTHAPLLNHYQDYEYVAGVDEAGRGCLAGPVVAAAVILPLSYTNSIIQDSKKLLLQQRNEAQKAILNDSIAWNIGITSVQVIDSINILQASFKAMQEAISGLEVQPEFLLIDGNRYTLSTIPYQCVVKGDSKYQAIAAASILAKTFRDAIMIQLAKEYPNYGWHKNMGYPTVEHKEAILKHGITPHHRRSYKLPQQPLFF